jgi:sulfite exporter TauE/SafE
VTLALGVLVASLLGSVHCAAMCGAFTCLYTQPGRSAHLSSQAAYNVGRLISYVVLGALAGTFGARLDVAGQGVGIANLAAVVAGLLMIAWAAGVFAAEAGLRVPLTLAPDWAKRLLGRALIASRHRSTTTRALLVGLLTTLLPCGWLYTFVVVAAGTGSPMRGALVMAAFWAGTVPMLVAVGAGAARLLGPLARRMPLVSAGLVFALGALSVAGKLHQAVVPHVGMMHVGR